MNEVTWKKPRPTVFQLIIKKKKKKSLHWLQKSAHLPFSSSATIDVHTVNTS